MEEMFVPYYFKDITYGNIKPGMYEISTTGDVRNKLTGRKLIHHIRSGYYFVSLKTISGYHKNFYIHRLVAYEFKKFRGCDDLQVNHENGNKLNNYLYNLNWVSPKENTQHAIMTNLRNFNGENSSLNKYSEELIVRLCEILSTDSYNTNKIIDLLGLSNLKNYEKENFRRTIYAVYYRHTWKHISKNYNFKEIWKSPYEIEDLCTIYKMIKCGTPIKLILREFEYKYDKKKLLSVVESIKYKGRYIDTLKRKGLIE